MGETVKVVDNIPVEQLGLPLTISPEILSRMRKIIAVLSNKDALKIFLYAKDGIITSTVAIKKLGLTQKRYYTRLKLLLEADILEKGDEGYRYTVLGDIIYQMGRSFKTVIEHKNRLELVNNLRKTKSLSLKEKERLMRLITPTEEGEIFSLTGLISPVRVVDNYEDLVRNITNLINQAEESIYLVSKYSDVRVVEALMRAIQKGIKIRALGPKIDLTNRINMLRALLSPRMVGVFLKAAMKLSALVRKTNISYSFIIIDEKWVVIDLPDPTKDTFYVGFIFQNVVICKRLTTIFNDMWKKADNI